MRVVAFILSSFSLFMLAGCHHARRPEPLELPAKEVIGQLHGALSTIDALPEWAALTQAYKQADDECKAAFPKSPMCADRTIVKNACACSAKGSCTPEQDAACTTTLAVRAEACAAEKQHRSEQPLCRVAASRRVPVLKHAEVTLNVARETNNEAGMTVLIFSAGQSQMYGSTQALKFVLVPRPRSENTAADAGDLASRLQIELRQSLQAAVQAALGVMTAPSFTIPVENGDTETFEPKVYAKEFAITTEIVRRDGDKFGLSWKDPSGTVGVSAGSARATGTKNQIVLVFAQED